MRGYVKYHTLGFEFFKEGIEIVRAELNVNCALLLGCTWFRSFPSRIVLGKQANCPAMISADANQGKIW